MVAPSAIATSKSSVIPIESSGNAKPPNWAARRSRSTRSATKNGRAAAGSATTGAIVIRPRTCTPGVAAINSTSRTSCSHCTEPAAQSLAANPSLLCSPDTLHSNNIGSALPACSAARPSRAASLTPSTECTIPKTSAACCALRDCRCPIICQQIASPATSNSRPAAAAFGAQSSTRFSPKSRCPAA